MSQDRIGEYLQQFAATRQQMLEQLRKVIVGQTMVIEQILAGIFTRGHCLLIGVPGLAKTLLVSSLSEIMELSFKRIQFTPDLMPTDITGTMILDESSGRREFRFVQGPVFTNILLADEINRTPPKTQAALLQAMGEREVTVGQDTHKLPDPFFVIATQNPIEQEGTYPLPEAQLDRFMFTVRVDYPSLDEEKKILQTTTRSGEKEKLDKILSNQAISNLQKLVLSVPVGDYVLDYVARLVRATRPNTEGAPDFCSRWLDFGAGPRAGQNLVKAGQAFAAMDGRYSVSLDDIRKAAEPVLRHRIGVNFQAQAEGKKAEDIITKLLETIPEPEVGRYAKGARR